MYTVGVILLFVQSKTFFIRIVSSAIVKYSSARVVFSPESNVKVSGKSQKSQVIEIIPSLWIFASAD